MTKPNFSQDDRDYILDVLHKSVVDVDFIKADGTLRTMKCTLRPDYLPPKPAKPLIDLTKTPKPENLEVIAVWDIDNKGWRSFRIDSVKTLLKE